MKSYYETAFEKLIEAGVPKNYIRSYLIDELVYFSRVYVYYNPYDIETHYGWYTTNGISISCDTDADRNRKCYGELKSVGFPTWEEYRMLFDGDEYDSTIEFMGAHERHQEEWQLARAGESKAVYY